MARKRLGQELLDTAARSEVEVYNSKAVSQRDTQFLVIQACGVFERTLNR